MPLRAVNTLDCHATMADRATLQRIAMQGLRLIKAQGAPSTIYHHFAGLG